MRGGLTVGLDVGTSAAKAVVLDLDRGVLGRGEAGYRTHVPRAGWAEQDPEAWWRAGADAVAAALADANVGRGEVRAIAVSGQGAALVLIDRELRPVHPALIHLDQRAAAQASALAGTAVAAAVAAANGQQLSAWNVAAKLSWIRAQVPHACHAVRGLTSAAGFVLSRLAGRSVQSESDAGVSDLIDLRNRCWSSAVLTALEVDPAWLPATATATEQVGQLSAAVAARIGLAPRTAVVAGGEDTSSAALAAGVVAPGGGYLSLGSAGVVGLAVPRGDPRARRLLTFPHVHDDLDLLSGSMTSAGAALDWWASVTGVDVPVLLDEARSAVKGSGGVVFLPYLAGELHPLNDPQARGLFSGMSLATTRAELTRAITEGSGAAIAHNLEVAAAAGVSPRRLSATGGPSRSAVWMQAVADATGVPVDVVAVDGAPLGDAILAAAENDRESAALVARHRIVRARYAPDRDEVAAAAARRERAAGLYAAAKALRD